MALVNEIESISEFHQENRVHFEVEVPNLRKLDILKKFKLQTTISNTNMVAFQNDGKIARYTSELDFLKEFFHLRSDLYVKRKEYMLTKLKKECETLVNRAKFIQAVISGELILNKRKRDAIYVTMH